MQVEEVVSLETLHQMPKAKMLKVTPPEVQSSEERGKTRRKRPNKG